MATDPFIGEISVVAFNYAPPGWLVCDGSLQPIGSYQALFSLLGTTYGGNGTSTFGLPDLRGRFPMGIGQGPRTLRRFGDHGGDEQATLTLAQLTQHNHSAAGHTHLMPHTHSTPTHNHGMPHTHTVSAHNHPMAHTHDMGAHTHTTPHSHQANCNPINESADPTGRLPGKGGGTAYATAPAKAMASGFISQDSTPSSAPSVANTGASSAANTGDGGAGNTGTPSNANTADAAAGVTGNPSNANTGDGVGGTGATGGGGPLTIMNPFQCLNFIIAYEGTYPPRP